MRSRLEGTSKHHRLATRLRGVLRHDPEHGLYSDIDGYIKRLESEEGLDEAKEFIRLWDIQFPSRRPGTVKAEGRMKSAIERLKRASRNASRQNIIYRTEVEAQHNEGQCIFSTLTYGNCRPTSDSLPNFFGNLNEFMGGYRTRKRVFQYAFTHQYGDLNGRFHHHGVLFLPELLGRISAHSGREVKEIGAQWKYGISHNVKVHTTWHVWPGEHRSEGDPVGILPAGVYIAQYIGREGEHKKAGDRRTCMSRGYGCQEADRYVSGLKEDELIEVFCHPRSHETLTAIPYSLLQYRAIRRLGIDFPETRQDMLNSIERSPSLRMRIFTQIDELRNEEFERFGKEAIKKEAKPFDGVRVESQLDGG